jgi:hypothetical protein
MPGVQVAHGRDEGQTLAGGTPGRYLLAQRAQRLDSVHRKIHWNH